MTPEELQKLPSNELRDLLKRVDRRLDQMEASELDEAIQTLQRTAVRRRKGLVELVLELAPFASKTMKVQRRPVAKFQHPDQPELVWSGKGRPPFWVMEHEQNGGDRDDLLIPSRDN